MSNCFSLKARILTACGNSDNILHWVRLAAALDTGFIQVFLSFLSIAINHEYYLLLVYFISIFVFKVFDMKFGLKL